jgi:acrylyl-CoA reductase (NADPH)
MEQNGQHPEQGPIVVTGATGGVGILAIDLLTRAGYSAHAITGKIQQLDFLLGIGAKQVISRQDLHWGQRPLENTLWAGAIDSVGSDMLAGLTRVIQPYGNIASCGLAAGHGLHTTVMPLHHSRGVAAGHRPLRAPLAPFAIRSGHRLGSDWKPTHLDAICTRSVGIDALSGEFDRLLSGGGLGRTLVTFN